MTESLLTIELLAEALGSYFGVESLRFLVRIEEDENGCWLWKGARWQNGYPMYVPPGKYGTGVHRAAWEATQGSIPDGLQIDHLCRVRQCIRPSHLEPVTIRTNVLRGVGISAENARKLGCGKADHPDEFDYVWTGKNGVTHRSCSACRHATRAAYRARERAAGRVPK